MPRVDKHSTKVQAAELLHGAYLVQDHLAEGNARTALETLDRMIKTAEGHKAARAAAALRASQRADYPEALDRAKLEQALAENTPARQINDKRRAMMTDLRELAGQRKADAGWAFVASLTIEQIGTVVGHHVENEIGAVKKLAVGGAKPDKDE